MKRLSVTLFTTALLLIGTAQAAPTASSSQAEPAAHTALFPYKAVYKIFRNDSELGKGVRKLVPSSDGRYYMSSLSDVHWFILSDKRTEESWVKVANNTVQPREYQFTREGTGPDRSEHLVFDSDHKKIKVLDSYKDEEFEAKWHPSLYDSLSYQLQMRLDIAAGATDVRYALVYKNKEHHYHFKKVGEETLKLPIGQVDTVKFRRVRDGHSSRETFIWLAKDYHYIVARIEQRKDGDQQADLRLASYHAISE